MKNPYPLAAFALLFFAAGYIAANVLNYVTGVYDTDPSGAHCELLEKVFPTSVSEEDDGFKN